MEIQHGKGPWANPVTGIVPLGTTLTMVVGINDKLGTYHQVFKYSQMPAGKMCIIQYPSSLRLQLIFHLMKCISNLIHILNCFG